MILPFIIILFLWQKLCLCSRKSEACPVATKERTGSESRENETPIRRLIPYGRFATYPDRDLFETDFGFLTPHSAFNIPNSVFKNPKSAFDLRPSTL